MRVLFLDDEEDLRIAAAQTFELAEIHAICCAEPKTALVAIDNGFNGVVVSDIRMPEMNGVEFLTQVKLRKAELPVIMLTGHADVELAVSCMKNGAYDFLEKPCDPARLLATVERAAQYFDLSQENVVLKQQLNTPSAIHSKIIGASSIMTKLREQISSIAASDTDILINGETGTGKEVCARAIHAASNRAQRPFVHINCAALPGASVENELFGSEVGAFAGAIRARAGRFEHARQGTICLDEIDSLSLNLQAKLLDVLHNRQITRLGSNEPMDVDIRVIALTKTSLNEAVEKGTFRRDLLYRLNTVTIDLPSLNNRREDIPSLFSLFVQEASQRFGVPHPQIKSQRMAKLAAQNWPGNLRELKNTAERFVLGLEEAEKESHDSSLSGQMAAHEKSLIAASIRANAGRLKETYEALGLSRKTLYDKMQKHGLNKMDFLGREK